MLPGRKYTPEDFLAIAWRHRWVIVVPMVLGTIAAVGFGRLLPNRYRSETLVLVVPQRVPESYVRATVTTRIEDRVQSIREQILSRTRLERIVDELNLFVEERKTRPMEDLVETMRDNVSTRVVRDDAFTVSFIASDPVVAQKVTARLASLFTEENSRDRENQAESTNQFLQTQLEAARQRLVDHEKRVEEFRLRYAGQLPDQVNSNLQALQNTEMQVQAVIESLNRDRDRRLFVDRQLADARNPDIAPPPPPPALAGTQPPTPRQQFEQAEAELRQMATRLKPTHPDYIALNGKVERLREQANRARENAPAAVGPATVSPAEALRASRLRELQAELETLDRQIAQKQQDETRLRAVISTYRSRIEAAPTREAEMIALTRDYDTLQQQYRSLLEKSEESRLAANLERRNIGEQLRILDPAGVPHRPFTPNRLLINAGGAAAGLTLGLLVAAFLEYRDRTFRTVDDLVGVMALPVLAVMPAVVVTAERVRLARRRRILQIALAGLTTVVIAGAGLWWKLYA